MKLSKVHIALLTNLTEGATENEHMTLYFSKSVSAKTVLRKMRHYNSLLPVELSPMFNGKLTSFESWSGDEIITPETNFMRWEEPYYSLLDGVKKPHITLAGKPYPPDLNWEHGLLVSQCHAGYKIGGTMYYFTVEELQDELKTEAQLNDMFDRMK